MRSSKFPLMDFFIKVLLAWTIVILFALYCRSKLGHILNVITIKDNNYLWLDSFYSVKTWIHIIVFFSMFTVLLAYKKRFSEFIMGTVILIWFGSLTIEGYIFGFENGFKLFHNEKHSEEVYNHVFCFKGDLFKEDNCKISKDKEYKANVRIIKDFGDKILVYIGKHAELIDASLVARRFAVKPEIKELDKNDKVEENS